MPAFIKIKITLKIILLSISMFGVSIKFAHPFDNNRITWITESFSPFYISHGKENGYGTVDKLLNMLEDEISSYEHQRRLLPILRIIEELKAKNQIACASFLYDPDITEFAQYSIPLFTVPPQELIIRRNVWLELGSPKSISLKKALSSGHLTLGLGEGRNYGKNLTKIIDQFRQDTSKIYFRVGDHFKGLAYMIIHDRIDATIAYSGEVKYFLSQHGTEDNLVHVPIEENDQALLVYIVMPKSEWGNEFLKHVNEAIYRIRLKPEYTEAIESLFDHTDSFDFALENLIQRSKMHFQTE